MRTLADTRRLPRTAWLEYRRKGLGGSDAGAILGVHPRRSAYAVWVDKLGLLPEQKDNEAMRQGRDLEEYVARRFCEAAGKQVRRENRILQSEEHPIMLANIDRRIIGEAAGLECKTSKDLHLQRFRNGDFPIEHYAQCQHYMAVTGWPRWYLAVLVYGTDLKVFEIKRDEEDIAQLIRAENDFWTRHVVPQIAPPADGSQSTREALSAVYPQSNGMEAVCNNPDLLTAYARSKAEADRAGKEAAALENQIKATMGEAERMASGGFMALWKTTTRSTIDEKALAAAHPDIDLTAYRKVTTYRRFTLKEVS